MPAVDLRPLPVTRDPVRRLAQLLAGLALYGTSMALQIRAGLGLNPWDVLHEGLTAHAPWSFGVTTAITGVAVLLLWIPLRQRPGVGTVCNVVLIGLATNATLSLVRTPGTVAARAAVMAVACLLYAVATGAYIGAGLGPGRLDQARAVQRHRLVAVADQGRHREVVSVRWPAR